MNIIDNKLNTVFPPDNTFSLLRFSLPFQQTMHFKQQALTTREGLWLVQQDALGQQWIGEIAPLPGFSDETLAQAEHQLLALLQDNSAINNETVFPSIRFALYCLQEKVPYHSPQNTSNGLTSVPLLQGDIATIKTRYLALNQPRLVKLKVARTDMNDDIQRLHQLIAMNPQVRFRLDANQQWSAQEYNAFLTAIDAKYIDYIEEPTLSLQDNLTISAQFGVPIALDETLLSTAPLPVHSCIRALIIKPTLLGDPQRIKQYLRHAQQHQLSVSVSASFESPIAIHQLHHLAHQWQQTYALEINLGLDTLQALSATVGQDIPDLLQGAQRLWHSS